MAKQTWLERNFTLVIVSIVLLTIVVAPLIWQFWLAPTVFVENSEAGQDIAEDSIDSDKALQDYREFRTLWYDIQAQHEQTQNYKDDLESFYDIQGKDPDDWSRNAETRHGRIQDRITGSENQEASLISEYNAMSADATTSLYQCYLPNRVDKKLFITDGAGVDYKVDDPPADAPKSENLTGDECKFSGDPDPDGE